jgi:hypothetical protein
MCDLAVARREVAQQQRTLLQLHHPAAQLHLHLSAFLNTLSSPTPPQEGVTALPSPSPPLVAAREVVSASPASSSAGTDHAAAPAEWAAFEAKMRSEGLGYHAIASFENNFRLLVGGATGMLPEASLRAVAELPRLADLQRGAHDAALLGATVCLKLNGGLGTGMGLEKAKSLLPVKNGANRLSRLQRDRERERERKRERERERERERTWWAHTGGGKPSNHPECDQTVL